MSKTNPKENAHLFDGLHRAKPSIAYDKITAVVERVVCDEIAGTVTDELMRRHSQVTTVIQARLLVRELVEAATRTGFSLAWELSRDYHATDEGARAYAVYALKQAAAEDVADTDTATDTATGTDTATTTVN